MSVTLITSTIWVLVLLIFFYKLTRVIEGLKAIRRAPFSADSWKLFGANLWSFTYDNTWAAVITIFIRIGVPGLAGGIIAGVGCLLTSLMTEIQRWQ